MQANLVLRCADARSAWRNTECKVVVFRAEKGAPILHRSRQRGQRPMLLRPAGRRPEVDAKSSPAGQKLTEGRQEFNRQQNSVKELMISCACAVCRSAQNAHREGRGRGCVRFSAKVTRRAKPSASRLIRFPVAKTVVRWPCLRCLPVAAGGCAGRSSSSRRSSSAPTAKTELRFTKSSLNASF